LGEEIVRSLLTKYYIFRISWVFGPNGKNFVNTILKLSTEKELISVVSDQIGSPTYTMDVAEYLSKEVPIYYGIHHLTNEGYISWYEFAKEIINLSKNKCQINPIKSEEYKTLARRGLNSRIYKNKFSQLRNWNLALKHFMGEKK
jgi:dTDP-4-dehydrorhamnose reductase